MADQDRGLPVRTEDDTDQKLQTKVVDPSTTSQQMTVDSDQNAHTEVHGNQPDGTTDQALQLSEKGEPNTNGDYDSTNNTKPASSGVIAHDRSSTLDETKQNQRVTATPGSSDSVNLDVSLHDEAGNPYSQTNPLPVTQEASEGTQVHNFQESADVVAGGTAQHDFSVSDGEQFNLEQILASSSVRFKVTLEIGDGADPEVFTTKAVRFASESDLKGDATLDRPIIVTGTANTTTVRLTVENRDNASAASIYTTIIGVKF